MTSQVNNKTTAVNPLSRLVLIKSPYLQLPHAVTLPYNYTPLPASMDAIPATDFSKVLDSIELSVRKVSALKEEHETYVERVEEWETQIREREVREKRRIAPGYLDTDQRLLVPTRVDTPVVSSNGAEDSTGIDRTFGNMRVQ